MVKMNTVSEIQNNAIGQKKGSLIFKQSQGTVVLISGDTFNPTARDIVNMKVDENYYAGSMFTPSVSEHDFKNILRTNYSNSDYFHDVWIHPYDRAFNISLYNFNFHFLSISFMHSVVTDMQMFGRNISSWKVWWHIRQRYTWIHSGSGEKYLHCNTKHLCGLFRCFWINFISKRFFSQQLVPKRLS